MFPPQIPANQPTARFTAAQIANALHLSKRAVLKCLADCASSGSVLIRGNEATAWRFDELPNRYQETLARLARDAGLPVFEYLESISKPWEPELALSELSESCIAEARQLRAALLPAFERRESQLFTPTDHARLGLADYQKAFGHTISERHWRRLMDRTDKRDAGAGDFNRLEIYLPDRLQRLPDITKPLPSESEFQDIRAFILGFRNPLQPSTTEKAALWGRVFELFEEKAETSREKKQVRRAFIKFLLRHGNSLAQGERAMRVAFDRKYSRWIRNDRSAVALLDGRELKRGVPIAASIPQNDIDKIVYHAAAKCGGRVAQAVRSLAAKGEHSGLSQSTVELINRPRSRKSYVNKRLNKAVQPEVRGIAPFFLGKRVQDDAKAHVERDYSKLASMEIINADDFTFPVYFYVPDGNGWFTLTRGQCLIMLDVRSWKVVAWSLQPERNYNSLVIRSLMNRVCDMGIPKVWYFERGIWKTSLIVKGQAPAGWSIALSPSEFEVGWQKLGVEFRHAIRARTKPVERVGGLLQDLMHGLRGYCGRDERRDCPQATKQAMDEVKARRVNHPGELFFSFEEWNTELARLIDQYNATSQDGQVLAGLSPDEAFEKNWPHNDPPSRIDANCWHLVAHYVRPVNVTVNGISFYIGGKKFVYRNERTGHDRGKTVLAFFDPESPDFLCVTDMNHKNPYLVERSSKVDFLAAPGDPVFEAETAKAAAHSSYPKTRYHVLKAKFAPTFRRNIVDAETAETAQQILTQRSAAIATQKQEAKERISAAKSFGRLGMVTPERQRPGQAAAAAELAQLLEESEGESL